MSVELYPTKGTFIDRWAVDKPEEDGQDQAPAVSQASLGSGSGLIHVSGPVDVSATQYVTDARKADTRAIPANGTDDFELSGYNTAGDAKTLVSDLTNGYSYKLFQADGENYILYPLMLDGAAQLVLSRLVLTGNLSRVPQAKTVFETLNTMFDMNFIIPEHSGFGTVMGAALAGLAESPENA